MPTNSFKKRNSSDGRNKSGEILKKFADMMISIIKSANANKWKKGWLGVSGSIQGLPQNISGRPYSGGNSFFLMFNTTDKGYKAPVYMTILQANAQNLRVKAGEKSVPIFKWWLSIKDENGKKVSEETYNGMTQEERSKMSVRSFPRAFSVFNIDQTNLAEVNKEKYDAIVSRFQVPANETKDTEGMYVNAALDRMFDRQEWLCKVQTDKEEKEPYYSPSRDIVVVPMKHQFQISTTLEGIYKDGMEYYSTALHEMAHSTGVESRLNRPLGLISGDRKYAHEELVAEMTSALVGSTMGFDKRILNNNAKYLKGWLSVLNRNPEVISTIMTDVGKASNMIIEQIDKQRVALNQTPLKAGNLEGIDNELTMKGKSLHDLQAQYSRINALYPFSVDDDRTRQIAKRIEQARQIITAYNENVSKVYGADFLFSEQAKTTIIPHTVYSGREEPTLVSQVQREESISENQSGEASQAKEIPASMPTTPKEDTTKSNYREIPVWEAYEKEKGQTGDFTYHNNAEEYGIDPLAGSKEGIELLKSGKVSAEYVIAETNPEQKEQVEDVQESVSLSEDINPQTDPAGVAEHIMETNHVSKGEAEKMAAPIVEDRQAAVNEKKQRAEQAKQEAVKKADEARKAEDERRREVEEQHRREEENRKNGENGGQAAKIVLHAALLLGALEMAKGNKGVWMNKSGKSNAEFLWAKTPITPYNNLMMNLRSDHKGYQTNVYAYFEELKKEGDSVRNNEKALPFNWTRWDYQNIATKDVITKGEYQALSDDEKSLYTKHHTRQTQQIFNIDQTSVTSKQIYGDLVKSAGIRYEELSERGVSNMMNFSENLKANHPTAMVIMRTDSKYEINGKDAARAGKILTLPMSNKEIDGKTVKTTGFPLDRIDDYLPKLVQAKQWVVVADSLDSAALVRGMPNEKEVLNKAYSTAKAVAQSAGMGYERVMVLQDAEYDRKADKIIVSGMADKDSGNRRQAAIEKANDIYRALIAATGSEQRLDRMGRNNLLPKDDAKYEQLVQELSAGVLMARQGLPATLSKDSMQHIGYWQRELRENPKLLGLLEKDVNNAVESIDKHMRQQVVKYEEIRKDLPPKDLSVSPRQYRISTDLAKLPDIESKEIVIVRDKAKGAADVILPEGASLEDDVEISGIRKDRIRIALGREGITNVRFYNAGGSLGLKEPNDYYKDKSVSLDRLKQYEFHRHKDIDVQPQIAATAGPKIDIFTHIRDDKGQYAFFFKAANEPSFSVYPNDTHKKLYFDVRGTDKQQEIHNALAQKYYSVAKTHPEIKVDLIMPQVPDVDVSKIERPTITRDKDNPNRKYVMATINGEFMKKEISKPQWDRMWLADDMAAYKRAVAAVVFEPVLKESAQKSQSAGQSSEQVSGQTTVQTAQQSDTTKAEQTPGKDESADDKEEAKVTKQDTESAGEENTEKQEENVRRPKGLGMG